MTGRIAFVVEGLLDNLTELILGDGRGGCRPYPEGQNLRGAFGNALLHVRAGLARSFLEESPALLYFRDALVQHRNCGGFFLPYFNGYVSYRCSSCGFSTAKPVRIGNLAGIRLDRNTGSIARGAFARYRGVVSGETFRFRVALNLKRAEDGADQELLACVERFAEEGIRLGRRSRKGKGLLRLRDVKFRYLTLDEVRRRALQLSRNRELTLHFLADVILREGESLNSPSSVLRDIKRAGKFFHPEYRSYDDPLVSVKVLSRHMYWNGVYLHTKGRRRRIVREKLVPRGSTVAISFREDVPQLFRESLVIAEKLGGIGKRTSFGKGEFEVLTP